MLRRLPTPLGCALAILLVSASSLAQPADDSARTEARTLGLSGVELYQAGRYDDASEKLEKAYALFSVPSIGLWSARALAKRGLLVEAANRYFEVASSQVPQGDAVVQRQAQVDAQAELEQLRVQIPRLVIRVTGADASELALSIDGQAVPTSALDKPRLVNPGPHHVEARSHSAQKSADVQLSLGQEASVALELTADAPPAHPRVDSVPPPPGAGSSAGSTQRLLGWVAVGVGGAGIVLGSVTGSLALGKRGELKDGGCTDSTCPHDKQDDVKQLDTLRLVSSIGFIGGGVLAAGGVTLLLSAPSDEHQVTAALSSSGITLAGRF